MTSPSAAEGPDRAPSVGVLLRQWRERRRLSQLELALQAEVSTRHVSFIETGRSRPSSEMILRLSEELEVPLRERNRLLNAAGYAPAYMQRPLSSPQLAAIRGAVSTVLKGHEPLPALLIDRYWNLLEANAAVPMFLDRVASYLLEPPINVLRVSLHPDGMAPRIVNLSQWRAHLLHRLRRQANTTADLDLVRLYRELEALPCGPDDQPPVTSAIGNFVVPLRFRVGEQTLSFVSITAVLGTPMDVTLEELAIESFYPADAETAAYLTGSSQPAK